MNINYQKEEEAKSEGMELAGLEGIKCSQPPVAKYLFPADLIQSLADDGGDVVEVPEENMMKEKKDLLFRGMEQPIRVQVASLYIGEELFDWRQHRRVRREEEDVHAQVPGEVGDGGCSVVAGVVQYEDGVRPPVGRHPLQFHGQFQQEKAEGVRANIPMAGTEPMPAFVVDGRDDAYSGPHLLENE